MSRIILTKSEFKEIFNNCELISLESKKVGLKYDAIECLVVTTKKHKQLVLKLQSSINQLYKYADRAQDFVCKEFDLKSISNFNFNTSDINKRELASELDILRDKNQEVARNLYESIKLIAETRYLYEE